MRRRSKIYLAILVIACAAVVISLSLGYYLMNKVPILARAAGSNPFEALRIAEKVMMNEMTQTPVRQFSLEDADLDYSQTVSFAENKFELRTAEQIIEWSVAHNTQPWVDDVGSFLSEAEYSVTDTTCQFVFIECASGNHPVMTVTYYSANGSLLVEKGWVDRAQTAYTLVATESIALELINLNSNYNLLVKAIIENLNGEIGFYFE